MLIILKACTIFGTYVNYIVFVSLSVFARHTSYRRIKKAPLSDCLFLAIQYEIATESCIVIVNNYFT